jgi:hypothetical protein
MDMSGIGCSKYLAWRQVNGDTDKIFYYFGLGLMGGLNMSRLLSGLDVRNVDAREYVAGAITFGTLTATMVTYCQLHPEDGYAFGITWQVYRQRPLVPGSQERWQQRRGM